MDISLIDLHCNWMLKKSKLNRKGRGLEHYHTLVCLKCLKACLELVLPQATLLHSRQAYSMVEEEVVRALD